MVDRFHDSGGCGLALKLDVIGFVGFHIEEKLSPVGIRVDRTPDANCDGADGASHQGAEQRAADNLPCLFARRLCLGIGPRPKPQRHPWVNSSR